MWVGTTAHGIHPVRCEANEDDKWSHCLRCFTSCKAIDDVPGSNPYNVHSIDYIKIKQAVINIEIDE